MKITIESPVANYFILEIVITDAMVAEDPWLVKQFPDIDQWCTDSFGEEDIWGEEPVNGWKRMRNKYFFTKEDMCSMFMLKWR